MRNHHRLLALLAFMILPLTTTADEAPVEAVAPPDNYPIQLGLDVGPFSGVGASVAWRPFNHFGIRGGLSWADMSTSFDLDEDDAAGSFGLDIFYQNSYLMLDYYPSAKRSFRISAGVLYNQNEFGFDATGELDINGNTYNGETVVTDVDWDNFMPYLTVGGDMFYFDRAHRWSMGIEVGVAFGEGPTTTVSNPTGGVSPGDLASLQEDFEDIFGDWKIWPILKLSVNFRF